MNDIVDIFLGIGIALIGLACVIASIGICHYLWLSQS